jgi:hypothetical protein
MRGLKAVPASAAIGVIDALTVTPDVTAANGHGVTITTSGWIVDPTTKAAGSGLVFLIDGRTRIDGSSRYLVDRADVAKALAVPGAERSGFATSFTSKIAPGHHVLNIGVIEQDGVHFHLLATGKSFDV